MFAASSILFAVKILLSVALPLWLYHWITGTVKKQSSSCLLQSRNDVPDLRFLLKRFWAEYWLDRKKRKNRKTKTFNKEDLESLRIKHQDSASSVFFYATDQKGNSLSIKFIQKAFNVAEVSLQLTTHNGQVYVLPVYPETVLTSSLNQEWSAAGLRIEFLEDRQRWRIVYNGMLRNLTKGDVLSDECFEHIRLNFIFIANADPLKWPEQWSTKLHAEALTCEEWRGPEWMNKIDLLDYRGYDSWGSMVGQVTYKDGTNSALYLRGIHQHRTGKHESCEFHESVTLYGVMLYGAMFCLNMSSTRHSFPQIQSGHFRTNNEVLMEIEGTGLELSRFTKDELRAGKSYSTWFTSNGVRHNIFLKLNNSTTLYYGQPCQWQNKIFTTTVEMDGKSGTGLLQLCCPCTDHIEPKTPVQSQVLKQLSVCAQKDDYVVHFDDAKCQNEDIVGGKGFSLAMLTSIKDTAFVVPKGFCVTVFALERQLHTYPELQKVISDIEDVNVGKKDGDLKQYCEQATSIIVSTPIVDEIKAAITKALDKLESENGSDGKAIRYAVRSSAVGEDSEETSAAGQNSTYLGVQGTDDVVKSIAMCWASLYSYQSVKYRKQHGMFIKSSMGVCVQKMVNADTAGVMFTRHPTTGDPSSIVITANYGLGESVVSATVDPDTIIVHKSWNGELSIESSVLGNKRQKIVAKNGGTETVDLKDEESNAVCLSGEMILRLAAIGARLESLYGSPRDIEWAVVDGTVYLLQARPITTLYTWTDFELWHELDTGVASDIDLITFANTGEVLPNLISPLSISIMQTAFPDTVVSACNDLKEMGKSAFYMIGFKCAMNYYNLLLSEPSKNITLLNKVADIAICGDVVITPEMHRVACERNGTATSRRRAAVIGRMIKEAIQNNGVVNAAKKYRRDLMFEPDNFHTAYSLYNEIEQLIEVYGKVSVCHMHTSRVSISYQIFSMTLLTGGYKEILPEHFSDIGLVLASCSDIVSGDVVKALKKVVAHIKESEKQDEFRNVEPAKGIEWLRVNCPLAAVQLDNFFKEHGHRCIQEMDLISEPWCLRPDNVVTTLQSMIVATGKEKPSATLSVDETVALLKTPRSGISKWILKKLIPHCRAAVANREMTKSVFVSVVHTVRMAFRRLGKLMTLEGYLPSEDLIFFLTYPEIGKLLRHNNATYVQKAVRRKKLFPQLAKLEYPEFSNGTPIPVKNEPKIALDNESPRIQGTSVCGGSIVGRACVITNIVDAHQIQEGDILITHSTDIAWSPYFPLLNGIVTELGGLISHGAVIAREYGLPCIIGAKAATRIFRTGDMVLLTADRGILQLVKRSK